MTSLATVLYFHGGSTIANFKIKIKDIIILNCSKDAQPQRTTNPPSEPHKKDDLGKLKKQKSSIRLIVQETSCTPDSCYN